MSIFKKIYNWLCFQTFYIGNIPVFKLSRWTVLCFYFEIYYRNGNVSSLVIDKNDSDFCVVGYINKIGSKMLIFKSEEKKIIHWINSSYFIPLLTDHSIILYSFGKITEVYNYPIEEPLDPYPIKMIASRKGIVESYSANYLVDESRLKSHESIRKIDKIVFVYDANGTPQPQKFFVTSTISSDIYKNNYIENNLMNTDFLENTVYYSEYILFFMKYGLDITQLKNLTPSDRKIIAVLLYPELYKNELTDLGLTIQFPLTIEKKECSMLEILIF